MCLVWMEWNEFWIQFQATNIYICYNRNWSYFCHIKRQLDHGMCAYVFVTCSKTCSLSSNRLLGTIGGCEIFSRKVPKLAFRIKYFCLSMRSLIHVQSVHTILLCSWRIFQSCQSFLKQKTQDKSVRGCLEKTRRIFL